APLAGSNRNDTLDLRKQRILHRHAADLFHPVLPVTVRAGRTCAPTHGSFSLYPEGSPGRKR
ncbi:hypothetical protein, partial [Candidatus Magnetobacterium casense]|uniref:hypothetical protein n=1 Tax=Candidatus Magnetobacterium casense TaxID=1455061 RepID=UPI001F1CA3EC